MIKSVKEIVDKIPTVQTSDFLMIKKDKLELILKEWGESIVDECSSNFECTMENAEDDEWEYSYELFNGKYVKPVLDRGSITAVKDMIK